MKSIASLLAVIAFVLPFGGCKISTAHFNDVTLAASVDADKKPVERVTAFHKYHSMLHCCAHLVNVPSETKSKAVWKYFPEGRDAQVIDSAEVSMDGDGWVDFFLTPRGEGLPYGSYAVELSLDGKFDRAVKFSVEPMFPDGPIRECVFAKNVNSSYFPVDVSKEFPASSLVLYAPVYVDGAAKGSVVSARWYTKDEAGTRQDIVQTDFPIQSEVGTGWVGFSLKPNSQLSPGKYFVDILLDGATRHTMDFMLTNM